MILMDAGPLIALQDPGDVDFSRCREAVLSIPPPYVTTWVAFGEAMHIVGGRTGWRGQKTLWEFLLGGALQIADLELSKLSRVYKLMEQYSDLPMDLADATLVCIAETLQIRRILTLDEDFRIYRLAGKKMFDVIP